MDVEQEYERDLLAIDHSGPHEIDPPRQALNRQVFAQCRDIMPIDDIHKLSDADLIYRFLIARKWNVEDAARNLREYAEWRRENNMNSVLWEPLPEEALALQCKFQGFDKHGHPVFYDCPEPKLISLLLQKLPREVLLRTHLGVMEQGRRWQKVYRTDRVSCMYDLSHLTVSIVTNTRAVGFLKEIAKLDQHYYPENMRTMLLCNGGLTFNVLYKVIRPLLDVRVQKKIQFVNTPAQVEAWISLDQVPVTHIGGQRPENDGVLLENFNLSPPGSPPNPPASPGAFVRQAAAKTEPDYPLPPSSPEGELEDDDVLSFKSLPSDEEGEEDSADEVGSRPSLGSSPNRVPPVVAPPTVLSEALPKKVDALDFVLKTLSISGPRRVEAYLNDQVFAYSTGQSVVDAATNALRAELIAEAGHPIHTFLIIADANRVPHYICKRRKLHNEIHIFRPRSNDPTMVLKKNMQATVEGERVHVMTCRSRQGANDQRDWQVSLHKDPAKTVQGTKVGDVVRFQNTLSPASGHDPYVLFALATGLSDLWFFA